MSDPQQVKERSESATTGSKRRKPSRRNSVPQEKESKANETPASRARVKQSLTSIFLSI